MQTVIAALAATLSFLVTGYVASVLIPIRDVSYPETVPAQSSTESSEGIAPVLILDVDTQELVFAPVFSAVTNGEEVPEVPTVVVPDPSIASGAKAIHIYLGSQTAELLEYGVAVKTYRISSGKGTTPTPTGDFMIHRKQDLRVSSQAVRYRMPNYMSFTKNGAFGLHGLPYLGATKERSGYWQEARDHIGIPVSHGCVRFLPEEAEEIYEWAEIGVPVRIRI